MPEPVTRTFAEWAVGDEARFDVAVSEEDIRAFAALSGDTNPLHTNLSFAAQEGYQSIVAHGMYGGALFSRLVGLYLPGTHALYLSQQLNFRKPMYAGVVSVYGVIVQKVDSQMVLKIATSIEEKETGTVLTDGEALVKLLH